MLYCGRDDRCPMSALQSKLGSHDTYVDAEVDDLSPSITLSDPAQAPDATVDNRLSCRAQSSDRNKDQQK